VQPERSRGRVFGEVAELYDARRPRYPEALIDEMLAAVPGASNALEIGGGTGIATRQVARRGLAVTSLEPDEAMATVARRKTGDLPIEMVTLRFEDFRCRASMFDLAFCAQSWHWIERGTGSRVVHNALKADGVLALFWNTPAPWHDPLRDAFDEIYARVTPHLLTSISGIGPWSETTESIAFANAAAGFRSISNHSYPWVETYDAVSYVELLQTHSDHRLLPPDDLQRLLREIAEAIDAAGGSFGRPYRTDLVLAAREA